MKVYLSPTIKLSTSSNLARVSSASSAVIDNLTSLSSIENVPDKTPEIGLFQEFYQVHFR